MSDAADARALLHGFLVGIFLREKAERRGIGGVPLLVDRVLIEDDATGVHSAAVFVLRSGTRLRMTVDIIHDASGPCANPAAS